MTNFPLGNFNAHAAADPKILAAARALLAQLPSVPAGSLSRVYLHWSVEPMKCVDAAYNVVVSMPTPGHFALAIATSPANNAPGVNDDPVASHTYMRNTGAVGVALDGMDGATEENFGPDGVTVMGLTYLCAAAAAVAEKYGVDVSGASSGSPYSGEPTIMTHAEAGNAVGSPQQYDAYGPGPVGDGERWDLAAFVPGPADATTARACGNALRSLIRTYKIAL